MHGSKTSEVNRLRKTQLLSYDLHVPMEQVVPVEGLARPVSKNQFVRLAKRRVANAVSEGQGGIRRGVDVMAKPSFSTKRLL